MGHPVETRPPDAVTGGRAEASQAARAYKDRPGR
jgi:hypothetical protein